MWILTSAFPVIDKRAPNIVVVLGVVLGTLVSCLFRVGCDRSKAASLHAILDLFLLRKNKEQRRDPVVQTKMLGGESKQRQVAVVLSKGEQTSSMLL